MNAPRDPRPIAPLSGLQLMALQLLAHGHNHKSAAKQMNIAASTMNEHLKHCYSKLRVHNAAHAVAEGFRRGLLK